MMYLTSPSSSNFARVAASRGVDARTQIPFLPLSATEVSPEAPERTTAVERPPTGNKLKRENGLFEVSASDLQALY